MTVKISECVRCGRPVGIRGREHCARCHYALAHRPARNQCPGCSQPRKLDEVTGKCVLCSRTCVRCGGKIGRIGRDICSLCLVKDRRANARQPCPRCGKPGRIREATGWCGHCSRPGRPPSPDAACRACGLVTHLEGDGLCFPCYTRSPHRITVRAENLAARLSDPPPWLPRLADYLAPRHNATAACQMITDTGRLLRDGGPVHPQSLLERAAARGGPLARTLEDFFIGVAEPAAVLFQGFRVDGIVPGGAGGVRGLLQFQQRVDGLPRPDHVARGAGLGDRGQLPEQVGTAQSVPGNALVAVVGRPGVMAGDPGERRQHPGRVHSLPAALAVHGDQDELA